MMQAVRITVELMPYEFSIFVPRDGISGTVTRVLDADRFDNEANVQRLVSQLVAEAFERMEDKRLRQQAEAREALRRITGAAS